MKKKLLALVLVVVLGISSVVGGTLAYLTDTGSDVNVMTLGNVDIEQHEYERVVNEDGTFPTETIDDRTSYVLQDFTQGKPILPSAIDTTTWEGWGYDSTTVRMSQVDSYGGMQVFFAASNAQDKFVTVENTGKTDAYIRTLVAIECGDGNANLVGSSFHFTWTNNRIGIIEIDGNKYYLTEYVYNGAQLSDGSWRHGNGILPAGDTSYPNLSQVYLHSAATNEDCEALDGNDNGTLDILVFSQAVQADGFADATTALDAAFGDITTANHPWSDGADIPVVVATADALNTALADDGDLTGNAVLTDNLTVSTEDTNSKSSYGATGVTVNGGTLDGNGKTLSVTNADGTWDSAINAESGTIKNLTVNDAFRGIFMGSATGDVYIDNVVLDEVCYTFNSDGVNKEYGVYISNSTLNGWTSYSDVHKEVVFTNCSFGKGTGGYQYAFCRPYNASVFENCVFEEGFEFDTSKTSAITFINCYYGETLITAENATTLASGETTFFYNGLNDITIK